MSCIFDLSSHLDLAEDRQARAGDVSNDSPDFVFLIPRFGSYSNFGSCVIRIWSDGLMDRREGSQLAVSLPVSTG